MTKSSKSPYTKLRSVDLNDVRWTRGFWAERFEVCWKHTLPAMHQALLHPENHASLKNFRIAAGLQEGKFQGEHWSDGDCYKWLEAVARVYAVTEDPQLDRLMDEWIEVISQAQSPDGYLSTQIQLAEAGAKSHQLVQGQGGWVAGNVPLERLSWHTHHELYNIGHLITAACIHHRATGKGNYLQIARKAADFVDRHFRPSPPELVHFPANPSIIMALAELYRTTGEKRYLKLAQTFVDNRGSSPTHRHRRPHIGTDMNQDRVPLRRESQAVGHAVAGTYLYCGATDVYAETGERPLLDALKRIWNNANLSKADPTGSVGYGRVVTQRGDHVHEAFGHEYQLPNRYNETCSTIGNAMWSWRMLSITGEAKYSNVVENVLYNGMLSATDVGGTRYFYCNPLVWDGTPGHGHHTGRRWTTECNCYCCPPSVARTIAKLHNWAYSVSEEGVWVHLHGGSTLATKLPDGSAIGLTQQTDYPWDGRIKITVDRAPAEPTSLMLRIPGWVDGASLQVNGERAAERPKPGSYAAVSRIWKSGDVVELNLPMPVRLMEANPKVENLRNKVAVMRGPLVYCLELPKQEGGEATYLDGIFLPENVQFTPEHRPGFLGGVTVLTCKALTFDGAKQFVKANPSTDTPLAQEDGALYQPIQPRDFRPPMEGTVELTLIPYYAWANRGLSYMNVWMPLATQDQLASQRRITEEIRKRLAAESAKKEASMWKDASGWTVVNDDHPAIQYGPGVQSKATDGLINGDEHFTMQKGSFFELAFTGTEIVWMGSQGPWRGYADVYLDGKQVAEVNPYAPSPEFGVELYRKSGLLEGEHRIRIVCQARKGHPDGMEPYINLDAFKYR